MTVEGKDWKYQTFEADYIVNALGMKNDQTLCTELRKLLPDVFSVGDAFEVKNIFEANHTAFDQAMNFS